MKENKSTFLKVYLILVITYAIYGLLINISFMKTKYLAQINPLLMFFTGIIDIGFIIFNIVALVLFIIKKLAKTTWILPIYYFIINIILIGIGVVIGLRINMQNILPVEVILPSSIYVVSITSSLFEFIFAIYLMKRFKII